MTTDTVEKKLTDCELFLADMLPKTRPAKVHTSEGVMVKEVGAAVQYVTMWQVKPDGWIEPSQIATTEVYHKLGQGFLPRPPVGYEDMLAKLQHISCPQPGCPNTVPYPHGAIKSKGDAERQLRQHISFKHHDLWARMQAEEASERDDLTRKHADKMVELLATLAGQKASPPEVAPAGTVGAEIKKLRQEIAANQ